MNFFVCSGNLGRDPIFKKAETGTEFATFSVAVPPESKSGETTWVNCTAFGHSANFATSYLKKGDRVFVQGRLEQQKWTDPEGVKISAMRLIVSRLEGAGASKRKTEEVEEKTNESIPF